MKKLRNFYKTITCSNLKIFLILFMPSLVSISWHYSNTQLPVADATGFLIASINIYQDFIKLNIYEFIKGLYFERSWRPTVFHLFYLPFLIISKGSLLFAIAALHTTLTFFTTYLIYKIIAIQNKNYHAALLAAIISISPAVIFGGASSPGFSEISLLPFILGLIYLLIKKDTFCSKKHSVLFTILFFLVISTRPVEGIIHIILPIILFFILIIRRKYISKEKVIKVMLAINSTFTLLMLTRVVPKVKDHINSIDPLNSLELYDKIFSISIITNIIILMIYLMISRRNSQYIDSKYKYLLKSIYSSLFLIFIWWVGFFSNLYEWIYRTSLGDVVSNMIKSDHTNTRLFFNIISHFGIFLFSSIFLLFIYLIFKKIKKPILNLKLNIKDDYIYLISVLPLPLILYFSTVQTNPRKVSVFFVILLVIFSLKLIYKNIKEFYLSSYLVSVLSILFFLHLNFIYISNSNVFMNTKPTIIIGKAFPQPIKLDPNPHNVVIEKLNILSKRYDINHIALPLDEAAELVDPFLLSMMSIGGNFTTNFPYTPKFVRNLKFINSYDYALLINPLGKMIKSEKQSALILEIIDPKNKSIYRKGNELRKLSPNQKYTYFLQYLYSSNKLKEYGWTEVTCFDINEKYSGCLIKKLDNK